VPHPLLVNKMAWEPAGVPVDWVVLAAAVVSVPRSETSSVAAMRQAAATQIHPFEPDCDRLSKCRP
jgi:hypothetical protein